MQPEAELESVIRCCDGIQAWDACWRITSMEPEVARSMVKGQPDMLQSRSHHDATMCGAD